MFVEKLELLWLRFIRLYTFYFPLNKGKWRLFSAAKKICRHLPDKIVARAKDGRNLRVNLNDWTGEVIYFLGEHENYCCDIFRKHIKNGDVCFDVGANIGWYTTFFAKLVGPTGQVHAFEPVPGTFAELQRNVEVNGLNSNVIVNNIGLGDTKAKTEIYLFPELSSGYASLADKPDRKSEKVEVKISTFDLYTEINKIEQVDFIKVDIEGAELMFLQGAQKLFNRKKLPVLFLELTLAGAKEFGYKPNDVIVYIKERANYRYFLVDETNKKLDEIKGFSDSDVGANVLCLPVLP